MHYAKLMLLIIAASAFLLSASFQSNDFESAERAYQAGDLRQAEALYSRVRPGQPEYPQALLRLGTIYYVTERPVQAEKSFEEYLRFRESAEAYCLLAGAQFNQKNFTQAYESAKKALKLDPHYAKAYTTLGMIYAAIEDWPDSEAAYRESLRLSRNNADTWYMMGRSYFLRNDFAHAKEAFEESLRLSPQQARIYENLALTLDLMNDTAGAEKVYREGLREEGLRRRPEPRLYIAYGKFLAKLGRSADSLAQLREAVRVVPQDGEARYELANQLFRMKRWAEAAQEAEAALQAGGPGYQLHYLLARIYTAMGNPEAASQHAREAARLAEHNSSAQTDTGKQ
jgi:Flp pilus assembly protein TadD